MRGASIAAPAGKAEENMAFLPDICGEGWWNALHAVMASIPCPTCRDHGVRLLNGVHDLVNWELGKGFHDEKNFKAVAQEYVDALNDLLRRQGKRPRQIARPAGMAMNTDLWGSRCRDEAGRFLTTEKCPGTLDGVGSPLTFAIGANGVTRYAFRFRVVDVHDLIASHDLFTFEPNPSYPQELQPRLRDRAATRLQVDRIAQNLEPSSLLTDFRVLDRGAPIIGPDLVVESGNGRIMALEKAAADFPERLEAYSTMLGDVAPNFGIPASTIEDIEHPVLVRQRLTEVDRKAFAEEANTPATIGASAIEQARSDANRITAAMLDGLHIGENHSIEDALRSPGNRSFVTSFLTGLPDTEQARLVDSDGRINQDAVRRMTMAVFVAAFQSGAVGLSLAEMAFESIDQEIRNVVNGIGRALGPLANAETLTRIGTRDSALSIGEDLGAAVVAFRKIKNTPGMTVTKYLAQTQLFDRELDEFQERMLTDIDVRSRSAKKIGTVLRNYARAVVDSSPPGQTTFIDLPAITKEQLWDAAVAQADMDPAGTNPGLFGAHETIPLEATEKQYQAITRSILEALERGVAPWRKPWTVAGYMPFNFVSGRPYRGMNVPVLVLQGFSDPRWGTFNQIKAKGGQVRKGERSSLVFFWKVENVIAKVKPDDDPDDDQDGQVIRRRFIFRMYNVFNVQQADGLNLPPLKTLTPPEPIPEAERICVAYTARSGLKLEHSVQDRAYYQPGLDRLHMPNRDQFFDQAGYYSTLFHELGHSTGHPSRLDRKDRPDEPIIFGSPNYSKEELVAEFCSAFLTSEVGLPNIEPSAAYIKSWLRALNDDPAMLVFAASSGQKAADFILGDTGQDEPEGAGDVREPALVAQSDGGRSWAGRLPRCSVHDTAKVEGCIDQLEDNPWAICAVAIGCSPKAPVDIEVMDLDPERETILIVSDEELTKKVLEVLKALEPNGNNPAEGMITVIEG